LIPYHVSVPICNNNNNQHQRRRRRLRIETHPPILFTTTIYAANANDHQCTMTTTIVSGMIIQMLNWMTMKHRNIEDPQHHKIVMHVTITRIQIPKPVQQEQYHKQITVTKKRMDAVGFP
jgi:hypothetical protein